MRNRGRAIAVLIASGILTGGCGSGGPASWRDGGPQSPAAQNSSATDGMGGADGAGVLGPAPSRRPGDPEGCRASALRAGYATVGGGMGRRYASIQLTNTSTAACTVGGRIGLSLTGKSGPVPTVVQRDPAADPLTLRAGGSVWLPLSWTVNPAAGEAAMPCQPVADTVAVGIPGAGAVVNTRFTGGPVCDGGKIVLGRLTATKPS